MGQQVPLFDEKPWRLDGFDFKATTIAIKGTPTPQQWAAAFELAQSTEQASPYWIGELWQYAQSRPDIKAILPQLLAEMDIDIKMQTFYNHGSVISRVGPEARAIAPSFTYSRIVADLTPAQQLAILEEARTEGWTTRELESIKKARRRKAVVEGQAILAGQYRVIYADPPWTYRGGSAHALVKSAKDRFPTMSIDEIAALPVKAHSAKNSVLLMWATVPTMFDNPGPREVIEAWGFEYKSQIVWDKVEHNPGSYVSVRHEVLLISTRGSCLPDEPTPMIDSVQTIRRPNDFEHSEKPEDFRALIVKHWTKGPYLELFGRKKVKGWDVFGNDARLWERSA